jgi:hypothetical protein
MMDFFTVSEVEDGDHFAGHLFRRKFGVGPPAMPHHLCAFWRAAPGELRVLSYLHFMPFGDIMLVGGACTDGDALRAMPEPAREQLMAGGGVFAHVLRHGFRRFAGECEAFFGYCGDARAEAVDLANGFSKTGHPHLLVNFHKPLHEVMQRALVAKAAAIGPF